jgi:hypothetical protein
VSDYALSTNLYAFAQSGGGFFAWPVNTGEAETINKLQPGDFLVPKFAQAPIHPGDEGGSDWQRQYCETIVGRLRLDPRRVREGRRRRRGRHSLRPACARAAPGRHASRKRAVGCGWGRANRARQTAEHLRVPSAPSRAARNRGPVQGGPSPKGGICRSCPTVPPGRSWRRRRRRSSPRIYASTPS